jgi:ankyrin repeat protein
MRPFLRRCCCCSILRLAVVTLIVVAWSSGVAFGDEIHDAARIGDLEKVKVLIKDYNYPVFSTNDTACETPLHLAAEYGHMDVVKLLLANGAEVNARDNESDTPLHNAAKNGQKDVVELLLLKGANVNAKNNSYGDTPLHEAAREGHNDVVELLLANGADVNARDEFGGTPLHGAAMGGLYSTFEYSPNGEEKDISGTFDGYMATVKILLAHNADVNAKSGNGLTPLHIAASYGRKAIAELLLEHGADINAKSDDGKTPLQVAKDEGHQDVVKLLSHPFLLFFKIHFFLILVAIIGITVFGFIYYSKIRTNEK